MNAEGVLVSELQRVIDGAPPGLSLRFLNVGAGDSVIIERRLKRLRPGDLVDRVDIEPAFVEHPHVGSSWCCPLGDMREVPSDAYDAVFANFVLEHVPDLQRAAAEIRRVLRPGGLFVCSVPNTLAPEFLLSRLTPTWFHRVVRRQRAWETAYAYRSIGELQRVFRDAGLRCTAVAWFPVVGRYLRGQSLLHAAGRAYDHAVMRMQARFLMGEVCLAFVLR